MRLSSGMKPKSDTTGSNGITSTASEASTPAPLRKKPKTGEGEATMRELKHLEDVLLVRGKAHL